MLINLLDLEEATVEDIMIPRSEIVGIDIADPWDEVVRNLTGSQYTQLPLYNESIDNVFGIIHLRHVLPLLQQGRLDRESLVEAARKPYFIPEGTSLSRQLLNFQKQKVRTGLEVDESGDIQGLVTLVDILEEVVGEFSTDPADVYDEIHPQEDGSFLVDAGINVRSLNRSLDWKLPTNGPKTLNGLILEYLESIPEPGTSLLLAGHPVEIVQVKDNVVKTVRIQPALERPGEPPEQPESF